MVWYARWLLVVRCNTPGEAPEVVEARKTWFVPGARSAIPGHEVGIVRTGAGHGSSMKSLGHGSSPKMAGTVTLHIVFFDYTQPHPVGVE